MVHSSPHSSAEQKNQLRGLNGLSAYPLSTSESHSEDMSVLMESKNHARLGSKPHLSVVIVKGLLLLWSWEEPSLSFSPLVLADLESLFTKEICRGQ